jgi:hypothetical protein
MESETESFLDSLGIGGGDHRDNASASQSNGGLAREDLWSDEGNTPKEIVMKVFFGLALILSLAGIAVSVAAYATSQANEKTYDQMISNLNVTVSNTTLVTQCGVCDTTTNPPSLTFKNSIKTSGFTATQFESTPVKLANIWTPGESETYAGVCWYKVAGASDCTLAGSGPVTGTTWITDQVIANNSIQMAPRHASLQFEPVTTDFTVQLQLGLNFLENVPAVDNGPFCSSEDARVGSLQIGYVNPVVPDIYASVRVCTCLADAQNNFKVRSLCTTTAMAFTAGMPCGGQIGDTTVGCTTVDCGDLTSECPE